MLNSVEELISKLRLQRQKIGFAESCTGGLLSAAWTKVPGVSDVYLGSVVAYSDQVKIDVLGVQQSALQKFGAVSEEVAQQMAQGLKKVLHLDWAFSITGVAGPGGGTAEKPVGTVCFAVLGPQLEESYRRHFSGGREDVQRQAIEFAVQCLEKKIRDKS